MALSVGRYYLLVIDTYINLFQFDMQSIAFNYLQDLCLFQMSGHLSVTPPTFSRALGCEVFSVFILWKLRYGLA